MQAAFYFTNFIYLRRKFSENKSNTSDTNLRNEKSEQQSMIDEEDKRAFEEESVLSNDENDELSDKEDSTISDDETNSVITTNGSFNYEYLFEVQRKYENGIETIYLPPLTISKFTNVPPTIKFVTLEENSMFGFFMPQILNSLNFIFFT